MEAKEFDGVYVLLVKVGDTPICRECITLGELDRAVTEDIVDVPDAIYWRCGRCKVTRYNPKDAKDLDKDRLDAAKKGFSVNEVIQLRALLREHGQGDREADPDFIEDWEIFKRRIEAEKAARSNKG